MIWWTQAAKRPLPVSSLWGKGQGAWGGCIYVVGVVDKPSAAVGKEAAQDEEKRAAKGHKYRPRVKGHEILAPRTGPAAFREAICI